MAGEEGAGMKKILLMTVVFLLAVFAGFASAQAVRSIQIENTGKQISDTLSFEYLYDMAQKSTSYEVDGENMTASLPNFTQSILTYDDDKDQLNVVDRNHGFLFTLYSDGRRNWYYLGKS